MAGSTYYGSITSVRAVEDCIRATQRYVEGLGTMTNRHPIQGAYFRSKLFTKYYKVYTDRDVSLDIILGVVLDLADEAIPCVDVMFKYDYRSDKAEISFKAGDAAAWQLEKAIPKFRAVLEGVRGQDKSDARIQATYRPPRTGSTTEEEGMVDDLASGALRREQG